ncbi:hypothetical protein OEB99_05745 [Actinotalea sp. M2MS4P-6]|uniref:hypothetical protein n=1 Tax=Actinotalea sp. M2MS4P-6 TaxID=2983762 RepID=UPI0021E3922A|nr:hypothetical protein [Actinotalea sp. M2MS4P-6]MCV2393806.1 hypothetical protein [Actinotalea sp. M2MS4P-6]
MDLPPWPPLRPDWPRAKSLVQGILAFIGGGTALLAIGLILLMARFDLPAATFIVLHSQPLNIALAALTAIVPVGLYILLVMSPRLFAPKDVELEPDSIEALRQADFRRALDIVGVSVAWIALYFVNYVYNYEAHAAGDREFLLSAAYAGTLLLFAVIGAGAALVFLRLATVVRRGTARPITVALFRFVRAGSRAALVLTLVAPIGLAAAQTYSDFADRPALLAVFFKDENAAALDQHDPTLLTGYTVRWMAAGDGGYYLLPEDALGIAVDDAGAYSIAWASTTRTGPSAIVWVPGEPLSVARCDFDLATCIWTPREFDDLLGGLWGFDPST